MNTIFEGSSELGQNAIERIVALRKSGLSSGQIAKEIGTETWVIEMILRLERA
jgi:uncharacterized protein YoaH (UPF0181 family)